MAHARLAARRKAVRGLDMPLRMLQNLFHPAARKDEISHLFEQPFRVIPMYQMSKRSMLAVADSLTCLPPKLAGETVNEEDEENLSQNELTTYWSRKDISTVSDNLME